MLDELRRDLRDVLDEVLGDLTQEREPLKAHRLACLVALPATEVEGAHAVIVEELEARASREAAELLGAMALLHPEPLRSAAAEAAQRLGGAPPPPTFELRRTIRLDDADLSVVAGDLRADGGAFAVRIISEGEGLRGGLGPSGSPEEVGDALDDVDGEELHPSVAAAEVRRLLDAAARLGVGTDDELAVDGPIVVHALGLPPDAWPDLPLLDAEAAAPSPMPEPEPERAVPPRPPRDAARKKAQRRSQKAARKRNR